MGFMKLENCSVAEINVFCPEAEENVYLVWFKADPAEGASGPLFQFNIMLDNDTEDFYVATSGNVTKFSAAEHGYTPEPGFKSVTNDMAKALNVSDEVSAKISFFLDALLSDEADDLDESSVDYRWVDFPNAFVSFNNDLGKPENRIHIRVKSNIFGDPVPCVINDDGLEFEKDSLGLALAISGFEQTD